MASKGIDTFWNLLGQLRHLLAKAWGDDEKYRRLFKSDPKFADSVYSHFDLSGAAIAVADVLSRRIVLLQPQEEDDEPRMLLTVDLPFLPCRNPARKGFRSKNVQRSESEEFSRSIHDLFIRRRRTQRLTADSVAAHTAIHESEDTGIPEFLFHLPRGFQSEKGRDIQDYLYCPVGEVSFYTTLWRWILYLGSRQELTKEITDIDFDEVWNAPSRSAGKHYADEGFFGSQSLDYAEGLPESWMLRDMASSPDEWPLLRNLRDACDTISNENSFVSDCRRLGVCDRQGRLTEIGRRLWQFLAAKWKRGAHSTPNNARDLARELHAVCRKNKRKLLIYLFTWLHCTARFPIIPYYYLIVMDGRPKEHLAFPVLRSKRFAVDSGDGSETGFRTTSVAVALFSLNWSPKHDRCRERRFQQLEVFFKAVAERLLDEAFYGRIQFEELRRQAEANLLHTLGKEFKRFSDRAESFRVEWDRYSQNPQGPLPTYPSADDFSASLMLLAARQEGKFYEMPAGCAECLRQRPVEAESLGKLLVDRVVWPQAVERVLQPQIRNKIAIPGIQYPTFDDITKHFPKPELVATPFTVDNPTGLYIFLLLALRSSYEHAYIWTLHQAIARRAKVVIEHQQQGENRIEQITISNDGLPPHAGRTSQPGWRRDMAALERLQLPWRIQLDALGRASIFDPKTQLWQTRIVRHKVAKT